MVHDIHSWFAKAWVLLTLNRDLRPIFKKFPNASIKYAIDFTVKYCLYLELHVEINSIMEKF